MVTHLIFSDMGITSDRYGQLSLNSTEFRNFALSSNADDLKEFFAGATTTSNLSDNTDSTGLTDNLRTIIDTYANAITGMLVVRETRIGDSLART